MIAKAPLFLIAVMARSSRSFVILPVARPGIMNSAVRPSLQLSLSTDLKSSGQHLVQAGQLLQKAAASVGPQGYAGPHLFQEAGSSLIDIGESWSTSWEAVAYAADECAEIFHELSMLQEQQELRKMYGASCGELKEIASISGCTSIGPATAVPNLEALSSHMEHVASFVEESNAYQESTEFGRIIREASKSIQAVASAHA